MAASAKEELDDVVQCLKKALSDPELRKLNQRAVQATVWHQHPQVSGLMMRLRRNEEAVRQQIFAATSELIFKFHQHSVKASLARAGILQDNRVHLGSSLEQPGSFDLFCLDAKERLYLILENYGWLEDFFRLYPLHFYENSFQFVSKIPPKKLKVKVTVIGLGVGGSMAVSGLAKHGVEVVGYEKRNETGPSSVGSRYQNASWRAYNVASKLLDEQAYGELVKYRQKFNVQYDDGSTGFVESDRVQIILGDAIEHSLASAKRYGATLQFGIHDAIEALPEKSDVVALFTGAHTAKIFPEMRPEMGIMEWEEVQSDCVMWLQIKESQQNDYFCVRGGEVGAEHWHYTIESARDTIGDIIRVRQCLDSQFERAMSLCGDDDIEKEKLEVSLKLQMKQLDKVQMSLDEGRIPSGRFDYIFTNAPTNEHNLSKRNEAAKDGTIVLEGGYNVEVKIASNSMSTAKPVLDKFKADLVVCGGDACVPPNPQAAYGATLACEAAEMVVQLAVNIGHFNSILEDTKTMRDYVDNEWVQEIQEVKMLLSDYYNARGRAENYFQFVQTLICNLYSLPPFDT
jgi:hypothetical protein